MSKILFVVTGATAWTLQDGSRHPTGYWAEELLTPYRTITGAGHQVEFATPGGVRPVADEASLAPDVNDGVDVRPEIEAIEGLRAPRRLEDVRLADYDAVFYPGGHGPMEDLAVHEGSGRLLTEALDAQTPLGIVCHAPAAMLAAVREDGSPAFAGRRVTGFSNEEERQGGLADRARWLLEDRLRELGADVTVGEPWAPHVVVDGTLVTGQNPGSSGELADRLLELLATR
ncbi:type 1 glutamine amidotransferase domain-containing protein [Nocardioides sp.]|uniref:type 1 glutamine amidotransferase domain-containing protein n=1 Tax=Nocardioides sp. TaxID=35761 RepID=UPI00378425EC